MICIASTLIYPGRVSPVSASPLTSLTSRVRKTSGSVASSVDYCSGKRKTTRAPRSVRGKAGFAENVSRSSVERWCCNTIRSFGRCEYESDVSYIVMEMSWRRHAPRRIGHFQLVSQTSKFSERTRREEYATSSDVSWSCWLNTLKKSWSRGFDITKIRMKSK